MNKFSFDDELLEITCPTCGKKIKQKIRWFKQDGNACPHGCGTTFKTDQFLREIKKVEKTLSDFQRNLGNIKIKL